jgi:hypothetical protein
VPVKAMSTTDSTEPRGQFWAKVKADSMSWAMVMITCPPRILDSASEPSARTKVSRQPMRMPGIDSGSSTSRKICKRLAPRSAAASLRLSGTMAMPITRGNSMNGR